jgi:hypothetical protein
LPAARPIAVLAAAAVIALPLAACGGGDKSFIDAYNQATRPLGTLDARVGSSLRSASEDSDAEVAAHFGTLAEQTAKVNEDLAGLKAPGKAKPGFDALKTAVKRYHADLDSVSKGVKTGAVKQTRAAIGALGGDAEAVAAAQKTVKQKLEN